MSGFPKPRPVAKEDVLRLALESIARPCWGAELADSDRARADYWHGKAMQYRQSARDALEAWADWDKS